MSLFSSSYLLRFLEAQGGEHHPPCCSESREHSKGLSHHKSPLLAMCSPPCRSQPHRTFQVHLRCHFSVNFPLILQSEGVSWRGLPAEQEVPSLAEGPGDTSRAVMLTEDVPILRPDHDIHSSLWIVASRELGCFIQELSSLPFPFPHLFRHLLSYGSHFVFTKHQCFYPFTSATALTGSVR